MSGARNEAKKANVVLAEEVVELQVHMDVRIVAKDDHFLELLRSLVFHHHMAPNHHSLVVWPPIGRLVPARTIGGTLAHVPLV